MAQPREADRWRHLRLATQLTQSLGTIFLLLGGCMSIPLFVDIRAGTAARATPMRAGGAWVGVAFYLAPGAIYLVCSIFLARRRVWAVVTTMTVAGVQLMAVAAGVLILLYKGFAGGAFQVFILFPLIIMAVIVLALAQLEYELARSLAVIRKQQADERRGFEPLHVTPAMIEPAMAHDPPPPPPLQHQEGDRRVPPAQG